MRGTHDTDDTGLLGSVFASPSKVARVETEGTVLEVAPTNTDGVDPLGAELGVGGLTTELELSLLAVVGALSTRCRTFVSGGAGDTCSLHPDFANRHNTSSIRAKCER